MARIRIFSETSPKEMEYNGTKIWVCRCGLSKKFPFCDGSHKKTEGEEEGKTYIYGPDGRKEIEIKEK